MAVKAGSFSVAHWLKAVGFSMYTNTSSIHRCMNYERLCKKDLSIAAAGIIGARLTSVKAGSFSVEHWLKPVGLSMYMNTFTTSGCMNYGR